MSVARVIAALESKREQQLVSDESFVRKQRILDELAPRLWRELRQAIQTECKAHPEHLTFDVQPEQLAQVRCSNRRVLEIEYLGESKTVAYRCGDIGGECVIGLDGQNRAVLFDSEGKILPSASYLADELLAMSLQL